MTTYPTPLARLIQELSKLPGIGEKTAARLAFHMLKGKREDVINLADSIGKLRQEIGLCRQCFGFSEVNPQSDGETLCTVCRNPERAKDTICVVEEPADLIAVEKSQEFKGLYHVLQGTISPLDGIGPDALRIRELLDRIRGGSIREVIVATNPNHGWGSDGFVSVQGHQTPGCRRYPHRPRIADGRRSRIYRCRYVGESLEGRREI